MAQANLPDEQVEREIARLQQSQYVKLAEKERRVRTRRRQYLYHLRVLEKKGKDLSAAGSGEEREGCIRAPENHRRIQGCGG